MDNKKAHIQRHLSEYIMILTFLIILICTGFTNLGLSLGFVFFIIIMIYNIYSYDFVFFIIDNKIIAHREYLWINDIKEFDFNDIREIIIRTPFRVRGLKIKLKNGQTKSMLTRISKKDLLRLSDALTGMSNIDIKIEGYIEIRNINKITAPNTRS